MSYLRRCVSQHSRDRGVSKTPCSAGVGPIGTLGFHSQSRVEPRQLMPFLGFLVDSVQMQILLPDDKIRKIMQEAERFTGQSGSDSSSVGMDYRAPERMNTSSTTNPPILSESAGSETQSSIPGRLQSEDLAVWTELEWWHEHLSTHNGKAIKKPQPDMVMYTDASFLGWCATYQSVHIEAYSPPGSQCKRSREHGGRSDIQV